MTADNRQLSERVSSLEKDCASLSLELKAAQNRYHQEVRAHEETERSRLVSKEEANLEVVKGTRNNDIILTILNHLYEPHYNMSSTYKGTTKSNDIISSLFYLKTIAIL